jgi:hypothetical protein
MAEGPPKDRRTGSNLNYSSGVGARPTLGCEPCSGILLESFVLDDNLKQLNGFD